MNKKYPDFTKNQKITNSDLSDGIIKRLFDVFQSMIELGLPSDINRELVPHISTTDTDFDTYFERIKTTKYATDNNILKTISSWNDFYKRLITHDIKKLPKIMNLIYGIDLNVTLDVLYHLKSAVDVDGTYMQNISNTITEAAFDLLNSANQDLYFKTNIIRINGLSNTVYGKLLDEIRPFIDSNYVVLAPKYINETVETKINTASPIVHFMNIKATPFWGFLKQEDGTPLLQEDGTKIRI